MDDVPKSQPGVDKDGAMDEGPKAQPGVDKGGKKDEGPKTQAGVGKDGTKDDVSRSQQGSGKGGKKDGGYEAQQATSKDDGQNGPKDKNYGTKTEKLDGPQAHQKTEAGNHPEGQPLKFGEAGWKTFPLQKTHTKDSGRHVPDKWKIGEHGPIALWTQRGSWKQRSVGHGNAKNKGRWWQYRHDIEKRGRHAWWRLWKKAGDRLERNRKIREGTEKDGSEVKWKYSDV